MTEDDKRDPAPLTWKGEAGAPPPAIPTEWEIMKAQCELAADLFNRCAKKAGLPQPQSVEHALYMIARDWHNNMTMYGGLERFETALPNARRTAPPQILR